MLGEWIISRIALTHSCRWCIGLTIDYFHDLSCDLPDILLFFRFPSKERELFNGDYRIRINHLLNHIKTKSNQLVIKRPLRVVLSSYYHHRPAISYLFDTWHFTQSIGWAHRFHTLMALMRSWSVIKQFAGGVFIIEANESCRIHNVKYMKIMNKWFDCRIFRKLNHLH